MTIDEAKEKLSHHLHPHDDPCTDRGVDWPCDVAEALLTKEEIKAIESKAEKDRLERIKNLKKRINF